MAGVKRAAIVDPRNKRQSAETRHVETATKDGDNDLGEEPVKKNNAVHPIISIALVPMIEQSRDDVGGIQLHAC